MNKHEQMRMGLSHQIHEMKVGMELHLSVLLYHDAFPGEIVENFYDIKAWAKMEWDPSKPPPSSKSGEDQAREFASAHGGRWRAYDHRSDIITFIKERET